MTSEQERTENFVDSEYESEYIGNNDTSTPFSQSQSEATKPNEYERIQDMEDSFSRLGDSSDNSEKMRCYTKYLSLIKEIKSQNEMIEDIKNQINDLCTKTCRTRSEMKDIKCLRTSMEHEIINLHCMMNKAMQLQKEGSNRHYLDLPLATSLDEDNIKPYSCMPQISENSKTNDNYDAQNYFNQQNNCKQDICPQSSILTELHISCPEDKKLLTEIAAALLLSKRERMCKERDLRVPERSSKESIKKLQNKITCMQMIVNKLKQQIFKKSNVKQNRNDIQLISTKHDKTDSSIINKKSETNDEQFKKLKENYFYLLSQYAKKDCHLKKMEKRLKGSLKCPTQSDDGNESYNSRGNKSSEIELLKGRVTELKDEEMEFKCIVKEQFQQLEDYRNRYMEAQQKVEEQNSILDKLNITNKKIHFQINEEMNEVRREFQEKLKELICYPKLLENEQLKLTNIFKDKENLQAKLLLICKELKLIKSNTESSMDSDLCSQLITCQSDLFQLKNELVQLEQQRDNYCEQLQKTREDLDIFRAEATKIIARTKERTEIMRKQQQEKINRLEMELVQRRATASISVKDREAVIREMQGQLNILSYNFDSAQKQIKSLRNHIAYVSNDNVVTNNI